MRFRVLSLVAIVIFLGAFALQGQDVVVKMIPYDGTDASFLNTQIVADTVAAGGMSANRVYELDRDQIYLARATITIPPGRTMRIRGAAGTGAKPIVYLWETGTGSSPTRPPGNMFILNGSHLRMNDICVAGYYEFEPERVGGVNSGFVQTSGAGASIIMDGVVLSNTNGQHIRTNQRTTRVQVTNSIFANMGALTTSNLGAGKGIDLREVACDSFIIVNTTFVNYQDRPIRHYNFSSPTTGTGAIQYGLIDHNTFVNGMGFHGLFSLGNVGREITITNNLFLDAFALGEDSTDATRAAEWANTGEVYANGNNKITWIFTAPNDTTDWTVAKNYYVISDSGRAFLTDFGFPPAPPLSAHIQSRLGAAAAMAFTETAVTPVNIPRLMTNMMRWYEDPTWGAGKKKEQTNFVLARDDFDRRVIEFYRDSLDVSYPTSAAAYVGAEGGFPVGDLNWFPDKKAQWEQMAAIPTIAEVKIDANGDFVPDLKDQVVTISGVITTVNYSNKLQYFMQDATAGINLYSGAIAMNLNLGDVVVVKGQLQHYNGLTEIVPAAETDVTVIGTQTVPEPKPITAAELSEATEGFLVKVFRYRIVDPTKWPGAGKNSSKMYFTNGTDTVEVFVDKETDIDGTPVPTGWVNLIGVVDQFDTSAPYSGFYEIRPRSVADFQIITDVAERDANLPTAYALSQNYPNPFNPATTFAFDMPENGDVRIVVYNLLGKVVTTLHDGKLAAGYHKFEFNGLNIPSGIYFYRVESRNFTDVKKMTLIK
jgi:hypothetical protein